jgi:hypothetical protein
LRRWRGRRTRQAVRSLPPRGNEWSDHEVAAMDDNRAGLVTATLVAGGWRSQVWGWAPPSLGWCPGGNPRDVVN